MRRLLIQTISFIAINCKKLIVWIATVQLEKIGVHEIMIGEKLLIEAVV